MRTVAVYSIKGGVGKTATTVNLACLSARAGLRTLVWDLDPQGATTFYFRVRAGIRGGARKLVRGKKPLVRHLRETDHEGLDLLPADFSYRNLDLVLDATKKPRKRLARLLEPLEHGYEHVFVDCAPGLTLASESVFRAVDTLLVPTIPTTLSLRALEQLLRHLARACDAPPRVLPFCSMVDRRKRMHREVADGASPERVTMLRTEVPYSSEVERMGEQRSPVVAFAPRSEAAKAYERLWTEIFGDAGTPAPWRRRDPFGF